MTLSNSIFAVSGAATFLDARKDMSNLFACNTSMEPHPGLLTVGGASAANGNVVVGMSNRMAVTVRPFQAVLNRLGALLIMNDGDVTVSLQAAPSANSRIDVVYVKQREKRAPISDSEDGPIIGVVTGTANLTPVAPHVPDGAVALAQVKVPSGVTNTTASGVVITQVYPFAATRGEELRFRTKGDMDAFAALDGTKAVVLADNAHYVRNKGKWVSGVIQWTKTATPNDIVSIAGRLDFDSMTAFLYINWTNTGQFDSPAWKDVNIATLQGIRGVVDYVNVPCIENTSENAAGAGLFSYSASKNVISWTHTGGRFTIPANQWHRGVMLFPFEFA